MSLRVLDRVVSVLTCGRLYVALRSLFKAAFLGNSSAGLSHVCLSVGLSLSLFSLTVRLLVSLPLLSLSFCRFTSILFLS